MFSDQGKRASGRDFLLAALLVLIGLSLSAISLVEIAKTNVHLAQATQPLQSSPPVASDQHKAPAESKPGGERPTTPAPEPARPQTQAQQKGTNPALPPAPAEKVAPPIRQE